MKTVIAIISIYFFSASSIFAQKEQLLKGKVQDIKDESSLPGATILIINHADTLKRTGTITNEKGDFSMKLKPGNYDVRISFIGYDGVLKSVNVNKSTIDLGVVKLFESSENIEEIKVTAMLPPTIQKGDTTLYNPNAFKVNPDATAGELMAKMPGFYQVDGRLMAHGQEVAEVLVDGKKYFGNNVQEALNVLPNDVVKNIEVYKHQSDEAKFSGFEDKEEKKTVNIVTKRSRNKLLFGNVASGIGKDNRYGIDGRVNQFDGKKRIMVSGGTKNVDAPLGLRSRNFGGDNISGDDMQSNKFNLNLSSGKRPDNLSFRYGIDDQENNSTSRSIRAYTSMPLQGQIHNNESKSQNISTGNNLNFRWNYNSNPKHQILLSSNFSNTKSSSRSISNSETYQDNELINANTNTNSSEGTSYRFGQRINYAYKFKKKGRTLSVNSSFNFKKNDRDGAQTSQTLNGLNELVQGIDRVSTNNNEGKNIGLGLSYSDAIGEKGQLVLGYNYSTNIQKSDKESFDFDEQTSEYNKLDSLTSNQFKNTDTNHDLRMSYTYQTEKHELSISGDLKQVYLKNEETFPDVETMDVDYFSFSPSVRYKYFMKDRSWLNIYYNRRTQNPSLRNLQEVVDVSNPLFISTGNSDLERSSSNSLTASLSSSNQEKGTFFSANLNFSKTNNVVGRKTIVALSDTLIDGTYFLPAGGQFSQPENLDGQYIVGTSLSYSTPFEKIKSKLNINSSANFSHRPTFVNENKAFTESWSFRHGMVLSSNINEKIDFTLSSTSSFSSSKNNNSGNQEYIYQSTSLNLYWNFFKDFIFRTNASNSYENNFSTNNEEVRWSMNLGLSSRIFKNKRGKISFSAYDLLGNDDDRSHIVSELYTQDSYNNKLIKFYILTFSYKLRNTG